MELSKQDLETIKALEFRKTNFQAQYNQIMSDAKAIKTTIDGLEAEISALKNKGQKIEVKEKTVSTQQKTPADKADVKK